MQEMRDIDTRSVEIYRELIKTHRIGEKNRR